MTADTRPTGLRGGSVEAAIVDAACEIATSVGLTSITLRRLASTSGLAPAVIAEREPSMRALVARTFCDLAAAEFGRIEVDVDAAPSPTAALKRLVDALLASDHDLSKTVWADAWGVGRHNDLVAAAVRESMTTWHELLVGIIDKGVAAGEFVTDDADLAAAQFFALIDSTTAYALVGYLSRPQLGRLVKRPMELTLGLAADTL